MLIEIKDLYKIYNEGKESEVRALNGVTLSIDRGEFVAIIGQSGSGKSTLMNILGCLDIPTYGDYHLDGVDVTELTDRQLAHIRNKQIGFIFQGYNLIPALNARENVELPLIYQGLGMEQRHQRSREALERVSMYDRATHKPPEMSGGQQQRVAIARAIVSEPEVLLLDEPLSNLDAKLRVEMRSEIKRLHQELGTTIIYVTHDQTEALTMSTKIAIFFEGVLEQVAPPMELYQNPASIRVADFIGNPRVNFLPGTASLKDGVLEVESVLGTMQFKKEFLTEALTGSPMQSSGDHPVSSPADRPSFPVIVGVRPELIEIRSSKEPGTIEAQVYSVMPAGSETTVDLKAGSEKILSKQNGLKHYETDQNVWLKIDPGRINVFDKESGRLIKKAISDET